MPPKATKAKAPPTPPEIDHKEIVRGVVSKLKSKVADDKAILEAFGAVQKLETNLAPVEVRLRFPRPRPRPRLVVSWNMLLPCDLPLLALPYIYISPTYPLFTLFYFISTHITVRVT